MRHTIFSKKTERKWMRWAPIIITLFGRFVRKRARPDALGGADPMRWDDSDAPAIEILLLSEEAVANLVEMLEDGDVRT